MQIPAGYTELGRLGKTFQLEGGLRFYPLGEAEGKIIFELGSVFVSDLGQVRLERVRPAGKNLIVYLRGVNTPQKAKAVVGAQVYAEVEGLEHDDSYFLDKLLDLPVFVEGDAFGKVTGVTQGGGHDVLEIGTATGSSLVPLNAPYVRVEEAGVFISDAPEGLLELNT